MEICPRRAAPLGALVFVLFSAVLASSCKPMEIMPPPPPPPPAKIHTTYRVLGGVSMGAIGGMALASTHPDQFDGVAALGGPIDAAFFTRFMDQFVTAGFCSKQELETIMAADPVKLNDPTVINPCAAPHRGIPLQWEQPNDFNHLHVTNNGGTFERKSYLNMIEDLMLAYGNFLTENPNSPVAPPGIDPEVLRHPPADLCSNPKRVRGLKNAEYNPDGTYDAITFCDGVQELYFCATGEEPVDFCSDRANIANPLPIAQEQAFATAYCASKGGMVHATKSDNTLYWLKHSGDVDPCRERDFPKAYVLAFDFNGNGRRDYGEPIVNNGQERFDDVGTDGCADAFENGSGGCNPTAAASPSDLNHDNYDVDSNPDGTEQNWAHEAGEPFRDLGLDGVAGTGDLGEGNGEFDVSSGRKRLWALDGKTNFKKLSPEGQARFNVLVDGGIHDIFNLGLMAKHLFAAVKKVRAAAQLPVGEYRNFTDIPGMTDRSSGAFNPWNRSWLRTPKDLITLYGKDQRTDAEIEQGEGDHVGLPSQAASRFQIVFNWVAWMWPNAPMPEATFGQSTPADYRTETYFSQTLGAKWEYSISIPPGYGDPENANVRYPVALLLHGYGMEPSDFVAAGVLANNFVVDPNLKLRPVIYVFPNGRCCFTNKTTGARDCRNRDDQGRDLDSDPNWERECHSGTFWVNRKGYTGQDATPYGDAMFELLQHIDQNYRTLPAAEVEAR
ncbi:MAG: hypothetical protein U0228_17205 [Myxococcaceae bacterium]